jgi:hypothetical protein
MMGENKKYTCREVIWNLGLMTASILTVLKLTVEAKILVVITTCFYKK